MVKPAPAAKTEYFVTVNGHENVHCECTSAEAHAGYGAIVADLRARPERHEVQLYAKTATGYFAMIARVVVGGAR